MQELASSFRERNSALFANRGQTWFKGLASRFSTLCTHVGLHPLDFALQSETGSRRFKTETHQSGRVACTRMLSRAGHLSIPWTAGGRLKGKGTSLRGLSRAAGRG